jgi:hypothetical protein
MIDCGRIEGDRRWFCCMCCKKKSSHYKQLLPVIGRGQLKWYNPFVEEKNFAYVGPLIARLFTRRGHGPYHPGPWGGGEWEAMVME